MFNDSFSKLRTRRLIYVLSKKRAIEPDLITIYIPSSHKIDEVLHRLKCEHKYISNTRSKITRKNITSAIEKINQNLKSVKSIPKKGFVIFCGVIPYNGIGNERLDIFVIEPPESLSEYSYHFDDKFFLEPLITIVKEKEIYGIVLIDSNEATISTFNAYELEIIKEYHSGIEGKHKKGGESARRFDRLRQQEINYFFARIANHINGEFSKIGGLNGIFLGGPGQTKLNFFKGEYLNYQIQKKILKIIDTSFIGVEGIKEIVSKASGTIQEIKNFREVEILRKFLFENSKKTGYAAYGEEDVMKYLNENIVNTLLLSKNLYKIHITVGCTQCNYQKEDIIQSATLNSYEKKISNKCPICSNKTVIVQKIRDLVDEFIEFGEQKKVRIELLSTETDEGKNFLNSYGGVGAILHYSKFD